jgi:predicted metalloprotease with PDZ domain
LKSLAKPFFTSYFPALRGFWNDYDAKYYYLYLSPLYYANRKEQGGFGWAPGFVMKYSGIVDNTTIAIIAHETSHNWIGNSNLALGSNSLAHQWFGEGFTDYVCLTTLNKCGMYSDEVFMEKLNEYSRTIIRVK